MLSTARPLAAAAALSLLAACGGEGQKSAAPPAYNLNGIWSVTVSSVQKTCSDDPTIPGLIAITHDGSSNQFTIGASALGATPIPGTIDGATVSFATSQSVSDCNPLSVNVHLTLGDANHGAGTASYQCSYTGGSCGGSMNLAIARQP